MFIEIDSTIRILMDKICFQEKLNDFLGFAHAPGRLARVYWFEVSRKSELRKLGTLCHWSSIQHECEELWAMLYLWYARSGMFVG